MRKPINTILAENLSAWVRSSPQLCVEDRLAERSGVSQASVNRLKKGHSNPRIDVVDNLARAFGKRAHDLLYPSDQDDLMPPDLRAALSPESLKIAESWDLLPSAEQEVIHSLIQVLLARSAEKRAKKKR